MKKFWLSFLPITIILVNAFAQTPTPTPTWQWGKRPSGGTSSDFGQNICTDVNGNVFLTGYFSSPTISFGSTTLTNASSTGTDFFIAKYDASGNVLWTQRSGGTSSDYGYGVSTDVNGNVYVTGYFLSSSITFGSITLTNVNGGNGAFFVVKYDSSGIVQWAKGAVGAVYNYSDSQGISVDNNGNVIIIGPFTGSTITFGSYTLTNINSNATADIFVVKYDAMGNVLWAKSAGGSNYDFGYGVCSNSNGDIYVTGQFTSSSIAFGNTTLTNANTSVNNSADVFVTKYDTFGNVIWAQSSGGTGNETGYSIHADTVGNVLVTGRFASIAITFGNVTLTNTNADANMFIVKYDALGNALWAKKALGQGRGVSTDANDNVFITGHFTGSTTTFDNITLTNPNLGGASDMYIAKYNSGGTIIWAKCAGATGNQQIRGMSICVDNIGNVYTTGSFWGSSITFGNITFTNTNTTFADIFLTKLCEIVTPSITASGAITFCQGNNVLLDAGVGYNNYLWSNSATTENITVATSGNYIVTAINSNGCSGISATKIVTVNPVDTSLTLTGTTFVAYATNATYQWLNCATNQLIAGETNQTFNGLSSGNYALIVTQNGCTDTSSCHTTNITTGMTEINNAIGINIYPNPFTFQTTITFIEEQNNCIIKMMDVLSNEIQTINFTGKQVIIEKGEMSTGIYFLNIKTEKGTLSKKLIVQ